MNAPILAENQPVENLVLQLLEHGGRKADLSLITAENRESAVRLLRDIATGKRNQIGTVLPSELGAKIVLLRLADSETIQRAVAAYQQSGSGRGEYYSAEEFVWS